jgi:hypothetical protein
MNSQWTADHPGRVRRWLKSTGFLGGTVLVCIQSISVGDRASILVSEKQMASAFVKTEEVLKFHLIFSLTSCSATGL